MKPVPESGRISLYLVVLLVTLALAVTLALSAPGTIPAPASTSTPQSQLPATVPGLTREEGVFLTTTADDGSRAVYFIAQNTRHSIGAGDLQLEQQLNPLWPVRSATREDVLAFAEAAPIGSAKTGLITVTLPEEATASPVPDTTMPAAEETSPVADAPEQAAVMPSAATPAASVPAASPMPHAPQETPTTQEQPAAFSVAPAAINQPVASTEPFTYMLLPGDNLVRISARFGTTVDAILAANGLTNPNRIYFGQPLLIPGSPATPDVVESPAAPAPIAADFDEPTADSPVDDATASTYTVKRGDSAIGIARQWGVDLNELLASNGVADRNRVYIGQVLTIPGA